jgi:hypothetical protein
MGGSDYLSEAVPLSEAEVPKVCAISMARGPERGALSMSWQHSLILVGLAIQVIGWPFIIWRSRRR